MYDNRQKSVDLLYMLLNYASKPIAGILGFIEIIDKHRQSVVVLLRAAICQKLQRWITD